MRLSYYVVGWRADDTKVPEAGFERREDALEWMRTHNGELRGYHHWLLLDQAVYEQYHGIAPVKSKEIQ